MAERRKVVKFNYSHRFRRIHVSQADTPCQAQAPHGAGQESQATAVDRVQRQKQATKKVSSVHFQHHTRVTQSFCARVGKVIMHLEVKYFFVFL